MKPDLAKLQRLYLAADPKRDCTVGEFSKARDASIEFRNEIMQAWPAIYLGLMAAFKLATIAQTRDIYGPGSADLDAAVDEFKEAMEGRR